MAKTVRERKNYEYSNEELAKIARSEPDFKSPQFAMYVNDVLGSNTVLMMSDVCYRAYFNLLFSEWNEPDCGLPTDVGALVRLSKVPRSDFVEIQQTLLKKFFLYQNRYYNRRLLEERRKQIKKRIQALNAINTRYGKPTENTTEKLREYGTRSVFSDNDIDKDNDNNILKKEEGGGSAVSDEQLAVSDGDKTDEVEEITEGDEEIQGVKYFMMIFNLNLDGCNEELVSWWRKWVNRHHIRGEPLDQITATEQIKYLRIVGKSEEIINKIQTSLKNGWKGLDYGNEEKRSSQSGKSISAAFDNEKGRVSAGRIEKLLNDACGGSPER